MLHRIARAPSRRRRGPIRRPRTPWRRWRSLRVGTTTGRLGTETQGAGRGRTVEAQTLSHQAPIEAPGRESGDYQGKRQAFLWGSCVCVRMPSQHEKKGAGNSVIVVDTVYFV